MFTPQRVAISNITQANPAVITTAGDHNLTTGQVIRVHVPQQYGMVQLNQAQLSVTNLGATTLSLQYTQAPSVVNVNSTNFSPFVSATNTQFTAEIIPMGAASTPITGTAWQAQNGVCVSQTDDATTNYSTVEIPF